MPKLSMHDHVWFEKRTKYQYAVFRPPPECMHVHKDWALRVAITLAVSENDKLVGCRNDHEKRRAWFKRLLLSHRRERVPLTGSVRRFR